jgi:alpha-1,6-mannosyltransferase
MPKVKASSWLLFVFSGLLYFFIEYGIMRFETSKLLIAFAVLFLVYGWIITSVKEEEIGFWVVGSIAFRLTLLFALPNLSDDFYRFVWDGHLMAAGYHPFAEVPRYYIDHQLNISGIDQALFNKLNSPDYFTIYPPVNQFVFWLSVKLSPHSIFGSVVVMRSLIIGAEIGSLFLIRKVLKQFHLPTKNILLYALNPLVIIELTGNLHFEAFLIFFLTMSFWFLLMKKRIASSVTFALAICTKLFPVIFMPLLLTRLGVKRSLQFYFLTGFFCLLLFIPLLSIEIISGFRESIGYYFQKFEFNASIYYLVREWGYWMYGYNIIQTVGWKLGLLSILVILSFVLWDHHVNSKLEPQSHQASSVSLFTACLFVLSIYFLFSTIVHPWYIATLVAFSIFSKYRFGLLWSALVFATYVGYSQTGFKENLWLTEVEYLTVIGFLIYELNRSRWRSEQIKVSQPAH